MHKDLFTRVINAPINLFFDITSLGRILVRFSNDIEIFKGGILLPINQFTNQLSTLIVTIAFLLYLSRWTIPCLMLVTYLVIKFVRPILYAKHQIEKVGHHIWSSMHFLRLECARGNSVIRAYNMKDHFLQRIMKEVDKTTVHFIACESCEQWFQLRLHYTTKLLFIMGATLCISLKDSDTVSKVMLSLMLQYTIELDMMIRMVYSMFSIETQMV